MRLRHGHQTHFVSCPAAAPAGLSDPLFDFRQPVLERHHSAYLNERIPSQETNRAPKDNGRDFRPPDNLPPIYFWLAIWSTFGLRSMLSDSAPAATATRRSR